MANQNPLESISLEQVLSTATNAELYYEFLDTLDHYGWRKLGSEIKCTVPQLDCYAKKESPTASMLEEWITKDLSVQVLVDALKKIEHYSALRILMDFVRPLLPPIVRVENFTIPNQRECVFDNSQIVDTKAGKCLWPKDSILKVYFCESKMEINKKVLEVASTWTPFSSIHFVETPNKEESNIRITYYGIASTVLGTLAMEKTPDGNFKHDKTMYLDQLHSIQDDNLFRRIVLHEFGHSLGLVHEHEDPECKIPWDLLKVKAHFVTRFGWKLNPQIILNVTQPPITTNVEFDMDSIMRYPVPSRDLLKNVGIEKWVQSGANVVPAELSSKDKLLFSKLYK